MIGFGILVGLGIALIDSRYGWSNNPNFNNISAIPRSVMTTEEFNAFLFYASEEIGSGIVALLVIMPVFALYKPNDITKKMKVFISICFVLLVGIAKAALNYAVAYDLKIARLDARQAGYNEIFQQMWSKVINLTILHFIAGCVICAAAIIVARSLRSDD